MLHFSGENVPLNSHLDYTVVWNSAQTNFLSCYSAFLPTPAHFQICVSTHSACLQ